LVSIMTLFSQRHLYSVFPMGELMTEDGKCTMDIKRRIGLASTMAGKFNKIWKAKDVSNTTKVRLYQTFVVPVLLYGSECWCLRKEDEWKILTTELQADTPSNEERLDKEYTRETLQQKETMVDKIRRRILTWFGHVSRMGERRLPSRAMYCYIKERRKRGRPPKKRIDNIKEDVKLMELNIGEAVNLTTCRDRDKWRSIVATSSLANS